MNENDEVGTSENNPANRPTYSRAKWLMSRLRKYGCRKEGLMKSDYRKERENI